MVTCQVKIGKICVKSIIMVIIKKENEKDKKIKLVYVQTQKFGVDLETLKNKREWKIIFYAYFGDEIKYYDKSL